MIYVGRTAAGAGVLSIPDGARFGSTLLSVGVSGVGDATFEGGGAARFSGDLYLGQTAGTSGFGTVQVVGAGSELVADEIRVSDDFKSSGLGLLELGGGVVTASQVRVLGLFPGRKGELRGSGTIVGDLSVEGGWLKVGDPVGTLEVDGSASIAWGIDLQVAGPLAGEYDRLDVSGDVVLTGAVYLEFIDGYVPDSGDYFDVVLAGGALDYDPSVTSVTGLNLPPEAELVTTVMADRVRFAVVPEPSAPLLQAATLLGLAAMRRRSRCRHLSPNRGRGGRGRGPRGHC